MVEWRNIEVVRGEEVLAFPGRADVEEWCEDPPPLGGGVLEHGSAQRLVQPVADRLLDAFGSAPSARPCADRRRQPARSDTCRAPFVHRLPRRATNR